MMRGIVKVLNHAVTYLLDASPGCPVKRTISSAILMALRRLLTAPAINQLRLNAIRASSRSLSTTYERGPSDRTTFDDKVAFETFQHVEEALKGVFLDLSLPASSCRSMGSGFSYQAGRAIDDKTPALSREV